MTFRPPVIRLRGHVDVVAYPKGATYGPRLLEDHELVWVLRGGADWSGSHPGASAGSSASSALDLNPGTLLMLPPGTRHFLRWRDDTESVHAYVHFDVVDHGSLGRPESWPLSRRFSDVEPLASLTSYALALSAATDPATQEQVTRIVAWILELFVLGTEPVRRLPRVLEQLIAHVFEQWQRSGLSAMAIPDLAGAIGLSPGHLSRAFAREFGIGVVAALEAVRLAQGAMLLQRSNLSVGAISENCGFVSPFHFSRRFARQYGVPPRTYRRNPSADPLAVLGSLGILDLARRLVLPDQAAERPAVPGDHASVRNAAASGSRPPSGA